MMTRGLLFRNSSVMRANLLMAGQYNSVARRVNSVAETNVFANANPANRTVPDDPTAFLELVFFFEYADTEGPYDHCLSHLSSLSEDC